MHQHGGALLTRQRLDRTAHFRQPGFIYHRMFDGRLAIPHLPLDSLQRRFAEALLASFMFPIADRIQP